MSSEVRQRIVAGAADMIRRRGLNATSVRDLAVHAGAPLGSTYHYFPGGKQQLAEEAVRFTGKRVHKVLERELAAGPVAGLHAFLKLWREVVVSNDFRAGCPALAVTVEELPEGEEVPGALAAAAEVFRDWAALLAGAFAEHGVERHRADRLATVIIAAIEGTVALCRAQRSVRPLDDVAAELELLVEAALG
ncbi:TetR/AcrR family transcriptional regulator [Amycolatopsis anabasis]|uniref:TetR/AcrR family transcriptional regulator n=1 Tax=Amycolatopsis anabasis TaxID=1840409 RepID=UPI00131E4ABF|nr:TetR/AcrR family transcriptional regulator [Amycolatopsis anabasis]